MKTLIACVSSREDFGLSNKATDMLDQKDESWDYCRIRNRPNLPLPQRYAAIDTDAFQSNADLQILMHDDLEIFDPEWYAKILSHFEKHPNCAVVGFGGATGLGHPNLYKVPYRLQNLARSGYASNQRDWRIHGEHLTEPRRVAVIDGFLMAIRTELLVKAGGWPVYNLTHHCCDLWVCCEAARQGKEVWALPIDCLHYGGGTSITPEYAMACRDRGTTVEREHTEPHRWLYEQYRDVLPTRVR